MKRMLSALWREEEGILSFEWTMVLTLLVIGIVAGLAAARDAIIDELGDVAQASGAIDQSYTLAPISVPGIGGSNGSSFTDDAMIYTDCARGGPAGQAAQNDNPS
jgi:Flp pilus assembly pilin Flp